MDEERAMYFVGFVSGDGARFDDGHSRMYPAGN